MERIVVISGGVVGDREFLRGVIEKAGDPVLCKDVRSLTVKYYDEDGTEYDLWDSDAESFGYATPRSIGIKLELASASQPLLFETRVTLPVFREKKK